MSLIHSKSTQKAEKCISREIVMVVHHIIMIRTTFLGSETQIQPFLLSRPPEPEIIFLIKVVYIIKKEEYKYFGGESK